LDSGIIPFKTQLWRMRCIVIRIGQEQTGEDAREEAVDEER